MNHTEVNKIFIILFIMLIGRILRILFYNTITAVGNIIRTRIETIVTALLVFV